MMPLGIGPLLEQVIIFEEVVVPERGMSNDQRLHGHGVLFHDVADAWVGIDDDFVSKPASAAAIQRLILQQAFAERPMPVHQRHPNGGIGVEHLFRGDDLDLYRIEIEVQLGLAISSIAA